MLLEETVKAVDFSYWNTHTNPPPIQALKDAGIRCAMVRFGKGKAQLGTDLGPDRALEQNMQAIVDGAFPYMPYWRIFNLEQSSPVAQASAFAELLNKYNYHAWRAPVWIDAEEWQYEPEAEVLGPDMVANWIMQFSDTLTDFGYRYQGIYTRASWWSPKVSPIGVMNGYPLWVAHWPNQPARAEFQDFATYAETWDEYADKHLPLGPAKPAPWVTWDAWQFIGEGSNAGTELGFDSQHLDCNLIKRSSYERWFG